MAVGYESLFTGCIHNSPLFCLLMAAAVAFVLSDFGISSTLALLLALTFIGCSHILSGML